MALAIVICILLRFPFENLKMIPLCSFIYSNFRSTIKVAVNLHGFPGLCTNLKIYFYHPENRSPSSNLAWSSSNHCAKFFFSVTSPRVHSCECECIHEGVTYSIPFFTCDHKNFHQSSSQPAPTGILKVKPKHEVVFIFVVLVGHYLFFVLHKFLLVGRDWIFTRILATLTSRN